MWAASLTWISILLKVLVFKLPISPFIQVLCLVLKPSVVEQLPAHDTEQEEYLPHCDQKGHGLRFGQVFSSTKVELAHLESSTFLLLFLHPQKRCLSTLWGSFPKLSSVYRKQSRKLTHNFNLVSPKTSWSKQAVSHDSQDDHSVSPAQQGKSRQGFEVQASKFFSLMISPFSRPHKSTSK